MMERTKGEGGDGRVGVGDDDLGDGMQCSDHPYRNNPGVICVLCLQEKLGKLVSSSFPLPIRPSPSSSSSSPPPFTSDSSGNGGGGASLSSLSVVRSMSARNDNDTDHYEECYMRKARIPFLLAKKKKKMDASSDHPYHHHHHHHHGANIVFKRSKSIAAPIRGRFLDGDNGGDFSPKKRSGFWSFLYLSSKTHGSRKLDKASSAATPPATLSAVATVATGGASSSGPKDKSLVSSRKADIVVIEDDDSPRNEATPSTGSSFERKVSRSRSVGCGSRSFSGDFFERISTGFGDCTQRRVESQREGKTKTSTAAIGALSAMKERVKCGGIFGGFIITSSLSSYWVSSSSEDQNVNGRSSKSWGWPFASPMRAFTKPSSSKKSNTTVIKESNNKNTTPNLSAFPSLLAVRT